LTSKLFLVFWLLIIAIADRSYLSWSWVLRLGFSSLFCIVDFGVATWTTSLVFDQSGRRRWAYLLIRYSSIADHRFSSLFLSFLVVVADSCFCASARMSFQILKWCSRHFCYLLSNLFSVTIINLSISFLMWFQTTKLSYT